MLRKDHEVKSTVSSRHAFDKIKKAISEAPTLANPDYTKPLSILSLTLEKTLVVVLLQKNEDSHDQPIAFFIKVMRDVKLKYDIIDKQVYALIQALKSFRIWILAATDYFTKWVEAIPVRNATDSIVIRFIEENTLYRFGCPTQAVTDNAATLSSVKMIEFCQKYQILLHHSTPYYPQGNGLAKSSNKIPVKVIKKTLEEHKKSWDSHLIYAIWANRITPKRSTRKSPFQLVYGKDAIFPTNLAFPALKFLQDSKDEPDDFSRRMNQIIKLNENRDEVQYKLKKYHNKMKILFDRRARERDFREGDLVLRWDSRREEKGKHGKFDNLWFGPLSISKVKGNNTFVLQNIEGLYSTYLVNGRFLKHFIQY
eukprot:PITA_02864